MMKTLVVCVGNRLAGDDAAGPVVFDALEKQMLPKGVSLLLLETRGIALLDEFSSQDLLIVVDAVQFGAKAGTLHILDRKALAVAARMPVTSHDIALSEALAVGEVLYPERMPKEVLFVGIEGEAFNILGAPISAAVLPSLDQAVSVILKKLQNAF